MEWLLDHLLSLEPTSVHLTLAGILLLCGLGLPIPEDISLISGGYMAHLGVVNVHTVFLVCFASVLGGDCAAFFLGRHFGRRILKWGPARRLFSARKQLRVRAYFRKYGSKVIFVGRFLPGLRFSIFFSAGTLHVRPAVFLVYNSLAALLSVPFLVYLAWIFGEHIDRVIRWARRSEYGILVVAIAAGVFVLFKINRYRKQRRRELQNKAAAASVTGAAGASVAVAAGVAVPDGAVAAEPSGPLAPPTLTDRPDHS
jgi:membrane protein DedA with SNARE-associated domain